MKHDIFISYSRKDKDFVHGFVKEIENECLAKCWIDLTGIESGEQFGRKIQTAIDNTDIVLFMMSESSMQSEWTEKEVRYAKAIGRRVVPVLLPGAKMSGWFLFEFGNLDCIALEMPEQKAKLMNDIKSWTGFEAKQAAAQQEAEALRKAAEEATKQTLVESSAKKAKPNVATEPVTSAQNIPTKSESASLESAVEQMEKVKAFKKYRHGDRDNEASLLLVLSILLFAACLVTIIIGWISGWVNHPNIWIKSHMPFLWSLLVTNLILFFTGCVLLGNSYTLPKEIEKKYKKEFDTLIRKEQLEKGSFCFYFARKSFGEYFWTLLIALVVFAVNYYFFFHHWPFM